MRVLLLLLLLLSFNGFTQINYCPMTESVPCEDYIMQKLNPRDYDDADEYLEIRRACNGNLGDGCLSYITPYLSIFDIDDRDELVSLANNCKLTNMNCVDFVRRRLSTFDFNDLSEVNEVTNACTRSSLNCMEKLCQTRQFRNCRSKTNLILAARQCYTPCR